MRFYVGTEGMMAPLQAQVHDPDLYQVFWRAVSIRPEVRTLTTQCGPTMNKSSWSICTHYSWGICSKLANSRPSSFIFTLQEFSREVVSLIDAMRRIYHYEKDCMNRGHWWERIYRDTRKRLSRSSSVPRLQKPGLKRTFCEHPLFFSTLG